MKAILTKGERVSEGFDFDEWLIKKGFKPGDKIKYEIQWVVWDESTNNKAD